MSIVLKKIRKTYGQQLIFDDIDLAITNPGLYVLKGSSGSGKTTLLHILAGYETFDDGTRIVDDAVSIACIFQSYELIPSLNVEENIFLYDTLHHRPYDCEDELIIRLGLNEILHHMSDECSQGQCQRIGIARALRMNPVIILCDEPSESLDQENKEIVMSVLAELAQDKIVIIVSHELDFMESYHPTIYEIQNKKLIAVTKNTPQKELHIKPITDEVDGVMLDHYIDKILASNKKKQRSITWLLALVFLMLVQLYFHMFILHESTNVLNAHVLYVVSYQEEKELPFSMEPILEFEKLQYKGRELTVRIVPMPANTQALSMTGESAKDFHVLINQNMAKLLQEDQEDLDILQQPLSLSFYLDGRSYPLLFHVNGIVDEPDAGNIPQIYYDQQAIENWLKLQEGDSGSIYEVFLEKTRSFQIVKEIPDVAQAYETAQKIPGLKVMNILKDNQMTTSNERELFRLAYIGVLVVLAFSHSIYVVYSTKKEHDGTVANYAVLYEARVPLRQIKKAVRSHKRKYLLGCSMFLCVEAILFCLFFQKDVRELQIYMGYALLHYVFYTGCLRINQQRFHKDQIAMILKENKDQ